MSPFVFTYSLLIAAIAFEVAGSAFLQRSDGFTRLAPTLGVLGFYAIAFFMMAQVVKVIPLGIAYAIWSGLGIVLTSLISVFVLRQPLDGAALAGIALIITGVLVMNLFSNMTGH